MCISAAFDSALSLDDVGQTLPDLIRTDAYAHTVIQQYGISANADPRCRAGPLDCRARLRLIADREGTAGEDGEGIGLDELSEAIFPSRYVRGSDILDIFGQ